MSFTKNRLACGHCPNKKLGGGREAAQKTHSNNGDLVLDGIGPMFEKSLKIRLLQKAKLSLVDYVVFINVSCRQCASYNGERNGMMQPLFIQAFIYLRQDSKHFYERICLCNSQSYDG